MDLFGTSDIRARKGMPYGGMPQAALMEKMEVTPERDYAGRGLTGELAKDWQVGALLDRTPDPGYLASDEQRRNPSHSRSVINLHYNTTRSSASEAPSHPDLFLGFMGNDPRGSQNIPRFDKLRGHTAARFRQLEVSMGDSVGHGGGPGEAAHQEAERPLSGPMIQKRRVDAHKQARHRLRVFSTSRDGRSTGRNVVPSVAGVRDARAAASSTAREQWAAGDDEIAGSLLGYERSEARGGSEGYEGFTGRGGPTGIGRGHDIRAGAQLGRMAVPTADMPVARYTDTRSRRVLPSGEEAAHQQRSQQGQQQELGTTLVGASTHGHRALAMAMSGAAQAGRARAVRDAQGADAEWGAQEAMTPTRLATVGEADVARAYYQAAAGHEPGQQIVGRSALSGGASALAARAELSGARQQLVHQPQPTNTRSALALSMSQGVSRGLTAPEAGDSVRALYEGVRAHAQAPQPGHEGTGLRGATATPAGNMAAAGGVDVARQQGAASFMRAAAAQELTVANYTSASPVIATNLATHAAAQGGMPISAAEMAQHVAMSARSAKAPEYRGATQVTGTILPSADLAGLHFGARDELGFSTRQAGSLPAMRYDRLGAHENDTMAEAPM